MRLQSGTHKAHTILSRWAKVRRARHHLQHARSAGVPTQALGRSSARPICAHPGEGCLISRKLIHQLLCLRIAQEPGVLLAAEHVPARAASLTVLCGGGVRRALPGAAKIHSIMRRMCSALR